MPIETFIFYILIFFFLIFQPIQITSFIYITNIYRYIYNIFLTKLPQTLSAHPVASLPTSSQTNAVTQQASLTASKDMIPESRVTSPTDPADEETLQKTG